VLWVQLLIWRIVCCRRIRKVAVVVSFRGGWRVQCSNTRSLVLVALLCTRAPLCLLLAGPSVPLRASSPRWCRPIAPSLRPLPAAYIRAVASLHFMFVAGSCCSQLSIRFWRTVLTAARPSQSTTSSHSRSPIKPSHFQPRSHEHAAFSRSR
jgi:hypothetical protein